MGWIIDDVGGDSGVEIIDGDTWDVGAGEEDKVCDTDSGGGDDGKGGDNVPVDTDRDDAEDGSLNADDVDGAD